VPNRHLTSPAALRQAWHDESLPLFGLTDRGVRPAVSMSLGGRTATSHSRTLAYTWDDNHRVTVTTLRTAPADPARHRAILLGSLVEDPIEQEAIGRIAPTPLSLSLDGVLVEFAAFAFDNERWVATAAVDGALCAIQAYHFSASEIRLSRVALDEFVPAAAL
jgi:hypothetical protein